VLACTAVNVGCPYTLSLHISETGEHALSRYHPPYHSGGAGTAAAAMW